jgi:hypothetical protein
MATTKRRHSKDKKSDKKKGPEVGSRIILTWTFS